MTRETKAQTVLRMAHAAGAPDWWIGLGANGEASGPAFAWLESFLDQCCREVVVMREVASGERLELMRQQLEALRNVDAAVAAEREAILDMVDAEDDHMPGSPVTRLYKAIRARGAA